MHLSWFMHLFIVLLFSRFLSGHYGNYVSHDSEEDESTTKSMYLQDESEKLGDDESDGHGIRLSIKPTTVTISKHHGHHHDDHVEYDSIYDESYEGEHNSTTAMSKHHGYLHGDLSDYFDTHDELDEGEHNSTTTFSSSSSSSLSYIILTTIGINKTTTSKIQTTTTTHSTRSTTEDEPYHYWWTTTTELHPQKLAFYMAKTNRERLLLKIFTITVAIGMSILAVVLFTIHLHRKRQRYHGYHPPANTLPNKPPNQINI